MVISKRMAQIDSSGIRKVFDLAAKLESPIDFSIGQPDFDVPEEAKEAAIAAIREGYNRYTVTQGIPELRQKIKAHVESRYGWAPEEVLVTSGVSGGIMLAILALVDPGDEVLIPDPYFVMYKHLTRLAGGIPKFIDTYPDFSLKAEKIERAVTDRTKLLIINNPCNPTGAVYREDELQAVAQVARQHKLLVMSDEIYCDFCYDEGFHSAVKYFPHVLLLGGFSKSYAFTGWRLGYACGPSSIISQMTKLQQFSFVCAPAPVQQAGLVALDLDVSAHIAKYKRKRDLIYQGLKDKFEVSEPKGAFYIFPKVPRGTDEEFVKKAIESNVLVIPGSIFSEKNTHFRISFATSDDDIVHGAEVLSSLA